MRSRLTLIAVSMMALALLSGCLRVRHRDHPHGSRTDVRIQAPAVDVNIQENESHGPPGRAVGHHRH